MAIQRPKSIRVIMRMEWLSAVYNQWVPGESLLSQFDGDGLLIVRSFSRADVASRSQSRTIAQRCTWQRLVTVNELFRAATRPNKSAFEQLADRQRPSPWVNSGSRPLLEVPTERAYHQSTRPTQPSTLSDRGNEYRPKVRWCSAAA